MSSVLEFIENAVTVLLVGVMAVVVIVPVVVGAVEVEHTVFEIDPSESLNVSCFDAFEWTQANPQSCWLKDVAPPNIQVKSVTFDTFHLDKSSLKDVARQNILYMLVTCDTSHLEMSWLKDVAPSNMDAMSVTCDTSHLDKSQLKVVACANIVSI